MILVDVNLLVYVINEDSPFHKQAIAWWNHQLQSGDIVGLSWNSLYGFLRVITNIKVIPKPLSLETALRRVEEWLALPQVRVLQPTDNHFQIFRGLLQAKEATPKLISDSHFAALAIEYDCELQSMDKDFARFPGLRWQNPL